MARCGGRPPGFYPFPPAGECRRGFSKASRGGKRPNSRTKSCGDAVRKEWNKWLFGLGSGVGCTLYVGNLLAPLLTSLAQIYLSVMRFYFAARFSKRFALRQCRQQLEALGHVCTSRWLDAEREDPAG